MSSEPNERATMVKTALDHTWAWFTLHATQRLQSVNFYLIAVAFLSAAFVSAAKEKMFALAGVVACLGACISFFFYRMERRIRSLIHASEEALIPLQAELAQLLEIDAIRIAARVEQANPGEWKYSKVFRWLYLTTGTAFLFGIVFVAWSVAAAPPAAPEFKAVVQAIVGISILFVGYELLVSIPSRCSGEVIRVASRWAILVIGAICAVAGLAVLGHLVCMRL